MLRRKTLAHPTARSLDCSAVLDVVRLRELLLLRYNPPGAEDLTVTVGRGSSNALELDHRDLPLLTSRKHASFCLFHDGRVSVRDLGSTNGTWVNQVRLQEGGSATLEAGDVVSFGGPACIVSEGAHVLNPFMFVFHPDDPAATEEEDVEEVEEEEQEEAQEASETRQLRQQQQQQRRRAAGSTAAASPGALSNPRGPNSSEVPRMLLLPSWEEEDNNNHEDGGSGGLAGPSGAGGNGDLPAPPFPPLLNAERDLQDDDQADNPRPFHTRSTRSERHAAAMQRRRNLLNMDPNPRPVKRRRDRGAQEVSSALSEGSSKVAVGLAGAGTTQQQEQQQMARAAQVEERLECVICQELMVAPHSLVPCGHMFCASCLYSLLRSRRGNPPPCPNCRACPTTVPVRCLTVDNILTDVVEPSLSEAVLESRLVRKAAWESEAERAAEAWRESMQPRRASRAAAGSNEQLHTFLDNLRQARETLRSLTDRQQSLPRRLQPLRPVPRSVVGTSLRSMMGSVVAAERGQEGEEQSDEGEGERTYMVEYAQSDRSRCRACHGTIAEGALRMGFEAPGDMQLAFPVTRWYHRDCFGRRSPGGRRNLTPADFRGFENLSEGDQAAIHDQIGRA